MNKANVYAAYVVLALGIVTLCTTLAGIVLNFSPVPYWDQWDGTIGFYLRASAHPFRSLFEQHNEHRLFFSRLIFFVDVRYFGGRNVFELTTGVVLAALTAVLLYRIVIAHVTTHAWSRPTIAGVILVFVFAWMQNENFTWGFQSQWFATYLFALGSFHSLELSGRFHEAEHRGKSAWWLGVAIVSTWLAAGSMISGLLVAPLLICQAIYLRFPRARLAWLVLTTVILWIAYLGNWNAPGGALALTLGHGHILDLLKYVVLYLGAPAYHSLLRTNYALFLGALILLGIGYSLTQVLRSEPRRVAVALFVMALFVLGNAVVTAVGRLPFGLTSSLSSRYSTAALLLLCSLLFFLWLNEAHKIRRTAIVVFGAFVVAMVVQSQRFVLLPLPVSPYQKMLAGLALRSHVYDATFTGVIYPDSDGLQSMASQAEAKGLSIFAPSQPDFSEMPNYVQGSVQCLGNIDEIMGTATPGMFATRGWAFDPSTQKYARSVVLTDSNGLVIGSGLTGAERNDLKDVTHSKDTAGGWIGFFKSTLGQEIHAFGNLGAGRFCALPAGRRVPDTGIAQTPMAGEDVPTEFEVGDRQGFLPDAVFLRAPNVPSHSSIYGSYVGGDKGVGKLTLIPGTSFSNRKVVVLHYITGPSATGQGLRIQSSNQEPEDISLPGTNGLWKTATLTLPPASGTLQSLTLIDQGRGWGQWCGIALP